MSDPLDEKVPRAAIEPRVVREGPAANCSSIGSVVDTLFATAVVGGALFAAISAALATERVQIVGDDDTDETSKKQAQNRTGKSDGSEDDDAPAR